MQWKSLVDDPQYLADIVQNVTHMTSKPGVYVEVTVFMDPSMKLETGDFDSEWPSSAGDTLPVYRALAEAFHDNPRVLFGLTNEPHGSADHDAALAARLRRPRSTRSAPSRTATARRTTSSSRRRPRTTRATSTYFIAHPLAGDRIIYEVHPYNTQADFDRLITQPATHAADHDRRVRPGGRDDRTPTSRRCGPSRRLHEVPYIAWVFHQRCPPNLLQDTASDGCGLDAATGYNFPRTAWGDLLHDHLATPW